MSLRDQARLSDLERQVEEILGRLTNSDVGIAERVQRLENQYRMLNARLNKKNNNDELGTSGDH